MAKEEKENKNKNEKSELPGNRVVVIHIDKKQYKSPNPTTGAALYTLSSIDSEVYDLFRETRERGDDEPILNNANPVKLKNGDHFFSIKKKLNPGGNECL